MKIPKFRQPTHPSEMLREEFLLPMNISQRELANAIHVSFQRVNELINKKRGIREPLSMHKWHIMDIKLPELRFKMFEICQIFLTSCALLSRIFCLILHSSCINRGSHNSKYGPAFG